MSRLKHIDELTAGEHLRMLKRHGPGGRGTSNPDRDRIPRTDEDAPDPSRAELSRAGLAREPKARYDADSVPMEDGASVDELVQQGNAGRELRQAERTLEALRAGIGPNGRTGYAGARHESEIREAEREVARARAAVSDG